MNRPGENAEGAVAEASNLQLPLFQRKGKKNDMKGIWKRALAVFLLALPVLGCALGSCEKESTVKMTKLENLPASGWQKTAAFPDWKGYTDDTLAMNSMLSFQFCHGQGTLYLRVPEEVTRFSLYVNGAQCDTSSVSGGIWAVDFSEAAMDGTNTLQLTGILPLGLKKAVEVFVPYPVVMEADGLQGIRPEALRLVSDLIASDVSFGFPGAQLAVVRNGRLAVSEAWGYALSLNPDGMPLENPEKATTETLYDLASVTKMFSVNYAVQKLVTDGALDVDTSVVTILGDAFAEHTLDIRYKDAETHPDLETQKAWKRGLTVRDVLRHQAGFPAGPHYNNPDFDMETLLPGGTPGGNPCYARNREETLEAICRTPLLYAPGEKTVYSDVDYMLLTFVTEAVSGRRLDDYMKEIFFAPMGLTHITFLPLQNGFRPEDCAATELAGNTRDGLVSFPGIRTETLRGEGQDERAWYCMEGISGHAGLFSNAEDLAKLASVMITGGYGGQRYFSRNVMDLFTAPKALDFGQWGLGWWRQGDDQRVWYFGTQAAPDTVGHQGWTGTLAMVDPSRNLVIAYLTNKLHSRITESSNPNGFSGSCYTASTLGFVPQILSIGLDSGADISGQLLDLLADMAAESLRLVPEDADAGHPRVKNALSKIAVLRAWATEAQDADRLDFADALEAMLP